jgi:hypothetical protein
MPERIDSITQSVAPRRLLSRVTLSATDTSMPAASNSLRAAAARQAPLLIALVVIALVIAFTRKPKPEATPQAPAAAPQNTTRSEPEPLPEEPPFGPLRVEDSGLPCDVDDVLARKCRRCHAIPPRHNAPFPLFTWAETQIVRGSEPLYHHLGRVVQSGFMPFIIEANPPIERLTDAEKKTLLDWVSAGAPSASCKPPAPAKKRRPNAVRPRSSP